MPYASRRGACELTALRKCKITAVTYLRLWNNERDYDIIFLLECDRSSAASLARGAGGTKDRRE